MSLASAATGPERGVASPERASQPMKGTVKLLIVSPSQGRYGGIEAFVLALATAVEAWPEIELQVCFKLVADFQLQAELQNSVSSLKSPVIYLRSKSPDLAKLIRWADVVHGQNVSPDVVFPSWFLRKGLALTIHNWRQRRFNLHSILWGLGARLADRRWYNSRFVWNTWEPRGKRPGSDCVPTVCRLPQTWRPPAERKGFLFVGRWIENKGIEELIAAYSQSQLDARQWPLTLIGDGPLRPKVEALIRQAGLRGVELPGFIDDENKAQRLACARWLVAPARTREDLGLTPIEARSVGVPVIVTRDGGLPEAAGEAALLVEPGNVTELAAALRQAAAMSEEEYQRRAELGRSSLQTFLRPWEFYRENYAALAGRRSAPERG